MEEKLEEVTAEQFLHEGVPMIGFDTARALWETGQEVTFVCALSRTDRLIPGSEWIPVSKIEDEAERKLPDKQRITITYCSDFECHASVNAAKALMELGYTNVLDFKGGLAEWQKHEMPVEIVRQSEQRLSSSEREKQKAGVQARAAMPRHRSAGVC